MTGSLEIKPDRTNSIGILRVILAGMVIYSHTHLLGGFEREWLFRHASIDAGRIAVEGFFVLSGWLVTLSWQRQPNLGRFLWHRFLRLAPAMWACLAVTALVLTPLLWLHTSPDNTVPFRSLAPSPLGYVGHNLVLPRSQIAIGPFPNLGPWAGDWNGSLWTIFYEGACYLMIAGLALGGLTTRFRVTGTLLIVGLLAGHVLWQVAPHGFLPTRLGRLYDTPGKLLTLHFLAGAALATWAEPFRRVLQRPWLPGAAALALAVSWPTGGADWLSPFLMPPALLWFAYHGPLPDFEKTVHGDYSYGLYLYGYPVQQTLAHFGVHHLGFVPYLVAGFLGTLCFAVISWHAVEKHALGLKSIVFPRPVAA